jgi:hypothetical protein
MTLERIGLQAAKVGFLIREKNYPGTLFGRPAFYIQPVTSGIV